MFRTKILKYLHKSDIIYPRRANYGNVYFSKNNKIIKSFNINKKDYKNEYNILTSINNKNIISVEGAYYSNEEFNIIMPFYNKGDLHYIFSNFKENQNLSRKKIIQIIKKLIKPIKYLHQNKLIHLDIKLENYVEDNNGNYILIDLEHVKNFRGDYYNLQILDEIIGTNKYAAPELYKNPSLAGPPSDVYSLGKIFYLIITRKFPDEFDIDWTMISLKIPELEDCIISMLNYDHNLRPTIFEVEQKINKLKP